MSEYQYYEFRSVDRPLGSAQLKRLRDLSTRAAISPTSFVNTYQWGDFKGDPDRLMEQMFDAFLYFANWGARRFDLRLPNSLANLTRIKPYCAGPFVGVRAHGTSLILEFHAEEAYDEYIEGEEEDWMGSLLPLRQGLLRGDYRCLYLAWLRCVQEEKVEDDEIEPPLPPGLAEDSESLSAFSSFFEIDHDLVEAAAEASATAPSGPSRKDVAAWVESIPGGEKDALLCAAACGELPALGAELLRRFHADKLPAKGRNECPSARRTAGELRAAASARAEKREQEMREKKEAETRRQEAEQAAARAHYLDRLAGQEEKTWDKIGELIATKRPNDYDRAIQLLIDLRDVATRDKREADFRFGLRTVREEHAKNPACNAG
jgi:hypothetical protein